MTWTGFWLVRPTVLGDCLPARVGEEGKGRQLRRTERPEPCVPPSSLPSAANSRCLAIHTHWPCGMGQDTPPCQEPGRALQMRTFPGTEDGSSPQLLEAVPPSLGAGGARLRVGLSETVQPQFESRYHRLRG